jgi:hypothetical protein
MKEAFDLRELWQKSKHTIVQIETKYGEVMQGKLIIVDIYGGRQAIFRKITDLKEYGESHGMRGMHEMTLHTIDIKSWRLLEQYH